MDMVAEVSERLLRLRDFLNLPFNALNDDGLSFSMGNERRVMAFGTGGHVSLICEVGIAAELSAQQWQRLLARMTAAHDYGFPLTLIEVDARLALLWACPASIDIGEWLRCAEDALTMAFDIHLRLIANTL